MLTNLHKLKLSLIFAAYIGCYGLAVVKLYLIQIKHAGFFTAMGNQQYLTKITAMPERGIIYDRHGEPLALNKDSLSTFIVPNNLHDSEQLLSFLKLHFPHLVDRVKEQRNRPFMYLKRHLTAAQKKLIEDAQIKDIQFLKEPSRYYPVPSTGPILGTVDNENHGTMGIELLCNQQLTGTKSTYLLEQEARSGHFHFKKETTQQGAPGKPIHTTIDRTIQFLASQELQKTMHEYSSTEGAVIVMDPTTGDILAMVNYPDFDPNCTQNLDLELTKNKIITNGYELGSVMKTVLVLGALAEGTITPETMIDCENKKTTYIGGMRVNTWKAHGHLTVSEIIENSNNIGTAKIADKLGTKLYDHYLRCGFAKKTGVSFPGEQRGVITHPSTWSRQSLASLSYGYEIRSTILQLAGAFCMISNNGRHVKPRLLLTDPIMIESEPVYDQKTMGMIRDILTKTITQGTARKANIKGYTIMGKTGTANLLVNGVYNGNKNIFTFAGIIEKGDYKRVIVTFVKEASIKDIYASTVAVPLFEHIAEKMLIHERAL